MRILGRDPAVWAALVAVAVQFLVAWGVDFTEEQQACINAAATAVMGLAIAWAAAKDRVIPAAAGLLGAVLQLGVSFGWDITQDQIASAGALLTALLALYLRTQVTAPITPDGAHVPVTTLADPPRTAPPADQEPPEAKDRRTRPGRW
jgi:hypothetical protein